MNKFFTFLLLVIFSYSISYSSTITFSDLNLENGVQYTDPFDGGDFTVTFAGGGNDGKYYTTGKGIRIYGGGTMTIAAKTGYGDIKQITITYAGEYKPSNNDDVVSVGTYNCTNGTWHGSASSIVFTRPSGSGHWRVQKIDVSLENSQVISIPIITGTTPFDETTEVTIACSSENSTIYYTTDGSTPDNTSNLYTGAFTISETTTVKAVAYVNDNHSDIATSEFVKNVYVNVETLNEVNNLADNTNFIFNGEVVCISQHGQYLYVEDNTSGGLIYGDINQTYETTNVIPYGWKGIKTTYNGFTEIRNATGFSSYTNWQHITATELTLDNISNTDLNKYVVAKNVLITANTTPVIEGNTAVFDFDNDYAKLFPTITGLSSNDSPDGDITVNTTAVVNGVSLTVSPKTKGNYENRLWYRTPILRMYSGTLTITAPTGYTITNVSIQGEWNQSNTVNTGDLSSTSWTGSTNELIITIAGNTQFKSITVTFETTNSNAPRRVQTMTNYILVDENNNQLKTYTSKLGFTDVPDDLTKRYDVYGVLDHYNSDYQLLPMGIIDPDTGVITDVTELNTDNIIKSINYYDLQGRCYKNPIRGLNIEIIKYNNGNIKVNKIIK